MDEEADLEKGETAGQDAVDAHHQALAGSPRRRRK